MINKNILEQIQVFYKCQQFNTMVKYNYCDAVNPFTNYSEVKWYNKLLVSINDFIENEYSNVLMP